MGPKLVDGGIGPLGLVGCKAIYQVFKKNKMQLENSMKFTSYICY